MTDEQLNPKVLGQLLLMQSILNNLPDNKSIFSFVCKGLIDIPGVVNVRYSEIITVTNNNDQLQVSYPISLGNSSFGELLLSISDIEIFKPYEDYLSNFVFMIGVILEERHQRQLNEQHKLLLEQRILERTFELNLEKENLAESQRRFTDLMVNIKLLSVMMDIDGNIIFCNNYLLSLTQYSADEIMGKNWFELFLPKQNVEQVKSIFKGVIYGDDFAFNHENEIITKNGETLIIAWNNTILFDSNKKIIGTASIGENITERKHAELELKEKAEEIEAQNEEYQQLNEELNQINQELYLAKQMAEDSEEKFRLMIKNSNDTFVLINENAEQFYISDAAIRDTGFTLEELRGPIKDVIYPEDLESVTKAWHEVLSKEGELVRVQYRHKHKYKDYIWYEAVSQNFINNPAIKAVVVNVRDITANKETEIELTMAKEKAEESDRLKTAFLQNMSHEIRTPMNAIMGFSDLLVNNFDNKTKLKKFSDIIGRRCNDLLDIINDILDIAKIESGQLPINNEEFSLNDFFTELSTFFSEYQTRIGKEHITINLQGINDESENRIITDKGKLKQIFINLISNALKFTETGKIEGGCRLDNNHNLIFYLSDTGIGIPADKQKMVFERFMQLQQGEKKNIGGTGLGLPIVKGLIDLLGGEIFLESEPNRGSVFTFSLPYKIAKRSNVGALVIEKLNNKSFANKTILIVEDDDYNLEYLKEILSGIGLNLLEAVNGKDAIELCITQPIDLVLMDIRLPDMDGYNATSLIRQHNPNLKIIAQTAYASNDDKQKALNAGCIDFISKPTKQELLLLMLNKHLSNY